MMNSSKFYASTSMNSLGGMYDWMIISAVLAVVGGILIYFLFLNEKNEGRFTGFLERLYDIFSFKVMVLEPLLKITYLIVALYVTISSFSLIGSNFLVFLVQLLVGNLLVRIIYEFLLISLVICRNTTKIAKNTTKLED